MPNYQDAQFTTENLTDAQRCAVRAARIENAEERNAALLGCEKHERCNNMRQFIRSVVEASGCAQSNKEEA